MNTLLVVEDEKLIRQGIVAMIRRSSVPVEEILECRNGEEALEILRKQRVDVMFTDIRMPKMDGLTLVNKMEELSQKPVVIVLSGYDEFSYAVEMMKHGVRDYILKPIKRETIEQLLENLERELSETRETEEEEERCFLNQLRYLMMNAEMAEEKEWMDMESRIRRHIGNDSFRILLTSKANGERFSKCSGILLEGVEGGVLYLLPEPEAERIMKEKDERFCLGVGKEHRSVMEIPEAYQEALLAREMAFIQKNPVEEYQKKCFEEKPELAQFQEKFILQVPTDRADTVLRKMRNWYFEAAHQRVSPYQLLTVTEAICKELDLFYRMPEKQEKCPRPLQYRDADLFLDAFEEWIHVYRESLKSQTAGKEKMEEAKKAAGSEPLLKLLPYKNKKAGIVTTGNEVFYGRIEDKFGPVIREKLQEFGVEVLGQKIIGDNPDKITEAIQEWLDQGADFVVCTGGMSVDPDDTTPSAIKQTGAEVVSYGAPVLPGAMFMLAYYQVTEGENPRTVAIMGLPGCVMYAKRTIFDLVLPRVMADDQVTAEELAALGPGGLCLNCPVCTFPNCGFGKGV